MIIKLLILSLLSLTSLQADRTCEEEFTDIYDNGRWGRDKEGNPTSGRGSSPENTVKYRSLLQAFLKSEKISSVVDIGCGDWSIARMIDWKGIHYMGVEVVQKLIDNNRKKYGSDLIQFVKLDATKEELPAADLMICKDVMIHLTNTDVHAILAQCSKYRYCLITNDVAPVHNNNLNNENFVRNFYARNVDITKPPFNVKGKVLLSYWAGPTQKQVVLITN